MGDAAEGATDLAIDEALAAGGVLELDADEVEVDDPAVPQSMELAVVEARQAAPREMAVLPSPSEWEATMMMAKTIANTTFVPKAYRGKPEAVVAGILYGREIGLGPMQALQKVHIIDGKPSLAAEEMLAQMRRGGIVILGSESTGERAMIHARRKDTGEEAVVEWTIEDAVAAGLTSKDNWQKYRVDMLWARCVGRLCRRLGSDLVGGMVYAAEEMQEWDDGGYGGSGYDTRLVETPVSEIDDWREERFSPSLSLDANAPKGWQEIATLAEALDPLLPDMLKLYVQAFYKVDSVKELDSAKSAECGRRMANSVARIRDELFVDGDFPPPSDDEYLDIFAWAFDGLRLDFDDPKDDEAVEVAETQEELPERGYDGLGDQAHIGTAAPDE